MELSEFLLARVAEDEAVAQQANSVCPAPWGSSEPAYSSVGGFLADAVGTPVAQTAPVFQAHIARHDPARVLAECAAKRAVVELHASLSLDGGSKLFDRVLLPSLQQVTKEVLMRLAQPYADHPDFDEAWRC